MSKGFWPYMRTEARIYVRDTEVFIGREWTSRNHTWVRSRRVYNNVTASSLERLHRLYAVRECHYAPGHYEKYRTQYQRAAA